ncbi:MAG: DNA polymerase I [Oscillospiraceae bacterium]|nr:DNA polymerase I [Oscillospiraceae bacterium]
MKVMLLDGNSIINRAFYGVRDLKAPDGTPTNALFGFLNILSKLIDDHSPDKIVAAFDVKQPTFRHLEFDGYKAKRKGMPDELAAQMPLLKEILDKMGIEHLEFPGFEADDILGSISAKCDAEAVPCILVTGDKDSLQLITDNTSVCLIKTRMGSTETIIYDPEVFTQEYGFTPPHLVDLKALMGDSSDNIPGVPGVGEKTAMQLIRDHGSIDEVYDNIDKLEIKDSLRKKLTDGEKSARMSYFLATIVKSVPVELSYAEDNPVLAFSDDLYGLFKRLGFNRFITKYGLEPKAEKTTENKEQISIEDMPEALESSGIEWDHVKDSLCRGERCFILPSAADLSRFDMSINGKAYSFETDDGEDSVAGFIFSDKVKKVSHNVKDLITGLHRKSVRAENFVLDTALAAYLLDSVQSNYSLEYITPQYLGREHSGISSFTDLAAVLEKKISDLSMTDLLSNIELPLCNVLAEMEELGFKIDRDALKSFGESLNEGIDSTQKKIWETAGHEFNINSPKQLGVFLFDELMLPYGKKTKTGWSTNADILEKLQDKHPVVKEILEFRMLSKLKSTYADGLANYIDDNERIHTNFQMTVTATGRLSSTEPNLQNIPVRKQLGAQIRGMFIPEKGNVLVDADYSQIELRILAHLANDRNMIDAFNSGMDFHAVTAAKVFGLPLEEVTPDLRSKAKAVNFGIVYGISAFALSQDINVSVAEAKSYMDSYYATYSGIAQYMEKTIEDAKADGYVTTMFGRRRNMPELKNNNFNIRSFGERVARNMPVQGSAADIIKIAMIQVRDRFAENGLKARLVLQVHDELIAECPEYEKDTVSEILKHEMENATSLSVPLLVEVGSGYSWAQAH